MARAIDADELKMFPYSEGSGTEEQIAEWIEQVGLSEDDTASRARDLCWKVIEGFINVVKTQPTLTPPNEWVSVEERLPEKHSEYIVCACDEGEPIDERIWGDTVVVCADYYDGAFTWYEGNTEYDISDIVTHWMSLPEPPDCRPPEGET